MDKPGAPRRGLRYRKRGSLDEVQMDAKPRPLKASPTLYPPDTPHRIVAAVSAGRPA